VLTTTWVANSSRVGSVDQRKKWYRDVTLEGDREKKQCNQDAPVKLPVIEQEPSTNLRASLLVADDPGDDAAAR
jgi:hypothetical protein